jgi:hypothetical protein
MAEKSEGKLALLAKYGVPSLALSLAVFVFQQQQQTFDRVQRITADGWQFYSNGRSELQYAGDVEDELALLKVIGYAFPNIFCDVRRDIYERAWSAEPPELELVQAPAPAAGAAPTAQLTTYVTKSADGRRFIQQSQLDNLRLALKARTSSNRPNQPGNLIEAWFPEKEARPCPSLDDGAGGAPPPAPTPAAAGGAAGDDKAETAKTADAPAASSSAKPAPAPSEAAPSREPASAPGASAGPAAPAPPPPVAAPRSLPATAAPPPDMAAASREVRVYFHILDTGRRDGSVAENARVVMSAYNYRVVREVARIPASEFPAQPEVRYFGAEQRKDAAQVAEYLAYMFQAEGLKFKLNEIGKLYPNMNPQNIEVWVPDPR